MMKRFFLGFSLFALVFFLVILPSEHARGANKFWWGSCLIGGGDCIDGIDGDDLTVGDAAVAVLYDTTEEIYFYRLRDSGASEDSPWVISPDANAGDNRWHLVTLISSGRSATPTLSFYDSDCTDKDENAKFYANCTDTGSGTEDCDLKIAVQIGGVMTDIMTVDADGHITLSKSLIVESIGADALDMSAASWSIPWPVGANPTVDVAGKAAIDTTAGQLIEGASANVLADRRHFMPFSFIGPDEGDVITWKVPYGITITNMHCGVVGGTSIVIDVEECDSDLTNCVNIDADITCTTTGAQDDGSLTNPVVDAGDWIKITMGTESGTVGTVGGSIYYTIVRE